MKILVTNHHLERFGGSELHTFDVCLALKKMGHEVLVVTFLYGYPMRKLFEREGLRVLNFLEEQCVETYFDLIIAHHFPVLVDVLLEKAVGCKKLILHSMSSFLHLEEFIIFNEDYCLYTTNSEENRQKKLKTGIQDITVFSNSVPEYFFSLFSARKKSLKSIAVVSNHLCNEVLNAIKILNKRNIATKIYGYNHNFEYITPELLLQHDAIVTIGRTVQYGFALGIPVYCYDHFGGPGWITLTNVDMAGKFNFSGRCCNTKKSGQEIALEITTGYKHSFDSRDFLYCFCKAHYNLEKNLDFLINKVQKKLDFEVHKALSNLSSMQYFVQVYKDVLSRNRYLEKTTSSKAFALVKAIFQALQKLLKRSI